MSKHEIALSVKHLSLDPDTAKRYLEKCYPGTRIIFSDDDVPCGLESYISVGVNLHNKVLFANKVEKLKLPTIHSYLSTDIAEVYLKHRYPGIQIRFSGLCCPDFPHPKRIPFISVAVDGTGCVISATMMDRALLHIKYLLLDANTIEKYLRKCYPDAQIRFSGLMYGPFPHPKRNPYISVGVDSIGTVISAYKIES